MNPAFRSAIFQLPLCEGTLEHKTDFVKGGKRKGLLEIQRLFVMLQCADRKACSTQDLTKTFGWHAGEGQQQQDIQELNRILFEAIEEALKGTLYESLIEEMFFGVAHQFITCSECGNASKVTEKFLDIPLFVDGIKGVHDSLEKYFRPDAIEGYFCQQCQKPTTVHKGPLLHRLPPVLTFNLTRIKYDMRTWDRIKINDRFEYPLELDLSQYLEPSQEAQAQKSDPDLVNYELKAIIIHRGGPYGGHYHAYIKDDLQEGNWNLTLPEKFAESPSEVIAEKKPSESVASVSASASEDSKPPGETKAAEEEEQVDWSKLSKKERKKRAQQQKKKNSA